MRASRFVFSMLFKFLIGLAITLLLRHYAFPVFYAINMLSIVAIAYIVISKNSPYSIAWVIIIFLLPVYGLFLYLVFGKLDRTGRRSKKIRSLKQKGAQVQVLYKDPEVYANFSNIHPYRKRIAGYLGRKDQPLYDRTKCQYYPLGDSYFEAMLEDMEQAKRFIFLEYFILKDGELWSQIKDVLKRKASQGIEVRLMIDDIGCILSVTKEMMKELKAANIQVVRFNDVHGFISRYYFNFRNHQKITVIDGNIGYTGGSNLADEYINTYPKLGHWKDNGIRLEGDAVWSLTVTFLQMWDGETQTNPDYESFRPNISCEGQGFYQPFTDGPTNDFDNIAKNIYKSFIHNAKSYVYITTPYLVIDDTLIDSLRLAAKGGTDVRIIVPKIWDKWFVHMVTLSNYRALLEAGVRIYEYTPGFIHAKTIISDDDHAVIGTINMDYRSFYLHYENGVWICGAPVIEDIKKDMLDVFEVSEEIQLEEWMQRPLHEKFIQNVFRLFAIMF